MTSSFFYILIDFFRCFFVRFSSPAFSFLMDYWKNSLPSCSMIHFSPLTYVTRVMAILDVLWACESSQKLGSSAQYLGNTFLYSFIKNKKLKKKKKLGGFFKIYYKQPVKVHLFFIIRLVRSIHSLRIQHTNFLVEHFQQTWRPTLSFFFFPLCYITYFIQLFSPCFLVVHVFFLPLI